MKANSEFFKPQKNMIPLKNGLLVDEDNFKDVLLALFKLKQTPTLYGKFIAACLSDGVSLILDELPIAIQTNLKKITPQLLTALIKDEADENRSENGASMNVSVGRVMYGRAPSK